MIIAFDLDGTLIDSARDIAESIGEMLDSYGATPLPLDEVVTMVGEGAPMLVRRSACWVPQSFATQKCLRDSYRGDLFA